MEWLVVQFSVVKSSLYSMEGKNNKKERWAIQHEFGPIGPTQLKNPLGAGWGLQPTLLDGKTS